MAKAAQPLQPLSEARYREINTVQGMIIHARDLMNKVEKCGVDVTEDRAFFDAVEAQFNEWKAQFFPTKP